MKNEITNFRVAKKLSPTQRGAIKLATRYGAALVCVRYRVNPASRLRLTTVELVVDEAPIKPRMPEFVDVHIDCHDRPLRIALLASGAVWDAKTKRWRMSKTTALKLNLIDHAPARK